MAQGSAYMVVAFLDGRPLQCVSEKSVPLLYSWEEAQAACRRAARVTFTISQQLPKPLNWCTLRCRDVAHLREVGQLCGLQTPPDGAGRTYSRFFREHCH